MYVKGVKMNSEVQVNSRFALMCYLLIPAKQECVCENQHQILDFKYFPLFHSCFQALQKASQVIAEIRETHMW